MMAPREIQQFVADRNAALSSLDEQAIRAFGKKWGARLPPDAPTFWAGVHKARLEIVSLSEEAKEISRTWLRENGFKTLMGDKP